MKLYAAALTVLLPCLAAGPEIDRNKALGVPTAPVTLEIFSDFTCPHCKVFHETMLPQLMSIVWQRVSNLEAENAPGKNRTPPKSHHTLSTFFTIRSHTFSFPIPEQTRQ